MAHLGNSLFSGARHGTNKCLLSMMTDMRDMRCSLSTKRYLPTLFKRNMHDYEISPRRTRKHLQEFHHFMYIMFDHVHSFSI